MKDRKIVIQLIRVKMLLISLLAVLSACGGEEVWESSERDGGENEKEFVLTYLEAWEESLDYQNFSLMEPYYVVNNHGYHASRRQHQHLVASRIVERLDEIHQFETEENEFGDERIMLKADFLIEERGNTSMEERTRYYYLTESGGERKVESIEREAEASAE
ncbi:TcaA NTF2-like domain-containing protein [Alkalicoccus halolimnae]|uniref:Nuclear transport factor 2 family protein n=1 Tax=Alkalicoccus halolimnae TaxID=1667239 RepID=A0A5C7FR09_9BACI|nr:hypothetical protein [Alkalicoccus halolimnae]TXF87145.1 hypothetical protein FTX54_00020 [Alkalicoccus halolimnae]